MFRPSPCPSHYAGRWATMPSADFCLITVKIAPHRAAVCHPLRSLLADDSPVRLDFFYSRACTGSSRPLVKQTSPNKNMNGHCTTSPFTVSREPLDFVTLCPLIPETQPCMTFLSVGLQLCASASFPPALTGWQLPSASSYAILKARTVGSPTGDLHPHAHVGRTQDSRRRTRRQPATLNGLLPAAPVTRDVGSLIDRPFS